MCLEKSSIQEGEPPLSGHDRSSSGDRGQVADNGAWAVFGVLAVFLICALAFEVPGLLILLLILGAPAMVRAILAVSQKSEEKAPASVPSFFMLFLNSLGIAAVVGLASFIAFYATCVAVCLGLGSMEAGAMTCGVVGGSVVGLIVASLLFHKLGPGKREP